MPQDETFTRISGYVEQLDMHQIRCTVREALFFAARLRRKPGETQQQLNTAVDATLQDLDLTDIQVSGYG